MTFNILTKVLFNSMNKTERIWMNEFFTCRFIKEVGGGGGDNWG